MVSTRQELQGFTKDELLTKLRKLDAEAAARKDLRAWKKAELVEAVLCAEVSQPAAASPPPASPPPAAPSPPQPHDPQDVVMSEKAPESRKRAREEDSSEDEGANATPNTPARKKAHLNDTEVSLMSSALNTIEKERHAKKWAPISPMPLPNLASPAHSGSEGRNSSAMHTPSPVSLPYPTTPAPLPSTPAAALPAVSAPALTPRSPPAPSVLVDSSPPPTRPFPSSPFASPSSLPPPSPSPSSPALASPRSHGALRTVRRWVLRGLVIAAFLVLGYLWRSDLRFYCPSAAVPASSPHPSWVSAVHAWGWGLVVGDCEPCPQAALCRDGAFVRCEPLKVKKGLVCVDDANQREHHLGRLRQHLKQQRAMCECNARRQEWRWMLAGNSSVPEVCTGAVKTTDLRKFVQSDWAPEQDGDQEFEQVWRQLRDDLAKDNAVDPMASSFRWRDLDYFVGSDMAHLRCGCLLFLTDHFTEIALACVVAALVAALAHWCDSWTAHQRAVRAVVDSCLCSLQSQPGELVPLENLKDHHVTYSTHLNKRQKRRVWEDAKRTVQADSRVSVQDAVVEGQKRKCWKWTAGCGPNASPALAPL